jgi:HSP20 family molecular chaperone IbpA
MINRSYRLPTIWDEIPTLSEGIDANRALSDVTDIAYKIMDRFWGNSNLDSKFFVDTVTRQETKFPKVNLMDLGDSFRVDIAIAGFNKEDIELEFKDNSLYIKASKASDTEDKSANYVLREISQRSFRRYIPLPEKVDKDSLSDECVSYKDGIISCLLKKEIDKQDTPLKLTIK